MTAHMNRSYRREVVEGDEAKTKIANAARYLRARWAVMTPEQRRDLTGEAGTMTSLADILATGLEPVN